MSEPRVDNFQLPEAWLRPYVAVSLFLSLLEEASAIVVERRSAPADHAGEEGRARQLAN